MGRESSPFSQKQNYYFRNVKERKKERKKERPSCVRARVRRRPWCAPVAQVLRPARTPRAVACGLTILPDRQVYQEVEPLGLWEQNSALKRRK